MYIRRNDYKTGPVKYSKLFVSATATLITQPWHGISLEQHFCIQNNSEKHPQLHILTKYVSNLLQYEKKKKSQVKETKRVTLPWQL